MLGDGLDAILTRIDRDPPDPRLRLVRYLRARIANPPRTDMERRKADLRKILGEQFQGAWRRGMRPDLRHAHALTSERV